MFQRNNARVLFVNGLSQLGLSPVIAGRFQCGEPRFAHGYKKTDNLRVVQLLLGNTKMDSKVLYLGNVPEDFLAISEAIEIQRNGPARGPAHTRHLCSCAHIQTSQSARKWRAVDGAEVLHNVEDVVRSDVDPDRLKALQVHRFVGFKIVAIAEQVCGPIVVCALFNRPDFPDDSGLFCDALG